MLSVQPGLRDSNDLSVGRKMAIFQLFFQSGRTKDLSAPLYYSGISLLTTTHCLKTNRFLCRRKKQLHVSAV